MIMTVKDLRGRNVNHPIIDLCRDSRSHDSNSLLRHPGAECFHTIEMTEERFASLVRPNFSKQYF